MTLFVFTLILFCSVAVQALHKHGRFSPRIKSIGRSYHNFQETVIDRKEVTKAVKTGAIALMTTLFPINGAFAKDGEFGALESTAAALLHPTIMIGLFGVTLYRSAYK